MLPSKISTPRAFRWPQCCNIAGRLKIYQLHNSLCFIWDTKHIFLFCLRSSNIYLRFTVGDYLLIVIYRISIPHAILIPNCHEQKDASWQLENITWVINIFNPPAQMNRMSTSPYLMVLSTTCPDNFRAQTIVLSSDCSCGNSYDYDGLQVWFLLEASIFEP